MGVAPGRPILTTERLGVNVLDLTSPDNEGNQPDGQPVVQGGPAAYMTTIPVKAIVKRMREAGIPCTVSYSAGTHTCNQILYWMLHYVQTRKLATRVGYIHLPDIPAQIAEVYEMTLGSYRPSMPLELMVQGLEIAIQASLEHPVDIRMGCGAIC